MNGEHVKDLLPAYALGALDEADLLAVARHLPVCPSCRAELAAWYRTTDTLSASVPLREPPADLRARVVQRTAAASSAAMPAASRPAVSAPQTPAARPEPVQPPAAASGWWQALMGWLTPRRAAAFAVLALVLVMAGANLLLLGQVSALRAGSGGGTTSGEMRLIRLKGTDAAPLATGYMIAFPGENDGSLTVDGVPALDPAHQYQVWLIKDGKRASGGVFSVNEGGYGVLQISADLPLDSYDAFGITIEPAGGSPGPTGKKVLGADL